MNAPVGDSNESRPGIRGLSVFGRRVGVQRLPVYAQTEADLLWLKFFGDPMFEWFFCWYVVDPFWFGVESLVAEGH